MVLQRCQTNFLHGLGEVGRHWRSQASFTCVTFYFRHSTFRLWQGKHTGPYPRTITNDPDEHYKNDKKQGTGQDETVQTDTPHGQDLTHLQRFLPTMEKSLSEWEKGWHQGENWHDTVYEGKSTKSLENWSCLFWMTHATDKPFEKGQGLSYKAVISLMNKAYLGSGKHMYIRDFYTRPKLFKHLYKQIWCLWTYRDNRKDCSHTTKSFRGTITWLRDGPLVFKVDGYTRSLFASLAM